MMMSPGSSPGSWSPSPEKVTFCPSSMPLSTDTSRIFLSRFTFRPLHFLHRSFGSTLSPSPWHSPHMDWICCIMPGPSCWIRTCIPEPRQLGHFCTAPAFPPTPSHPSQMTFFCRASFLTLPLYMSSRETESWCIRFFVRLGPRPRPLPKGSPPPPPPKNMSKMSMGFIRALYISTCGLHLDILTEKDFHNLS